MANCRNCRRPIKGKSYRSPMGATICRNCNDQIVGGAIGMMTGGGLGTAIAVAGNDPKKGGILNWIRRARTGSKD